MDKDQDHHDKPDTPLPPVAAPAHHEHEPEEPPTVEPEILPPAKSRSTLGDEISNDLLTPPTPEPQQDQPLGLDFEIPRVLPIPASQTANYPFKKWQPVPKHPIFGNSAYPIVELPYVGEFRLTGGFMEYYGHGQKRWDYNVIMPDGRTTKVGPKRGRGSGRFNIGIDYVVLDPEKRVNTWYGGEVVKVVRAKENDTEYGNRVVIRTNQTYNYKGRDYPVYQAYSHLDSYSVNQGDRVTQGQTIAVMGKTGGTTQDHVDLRTFIIPKGSFDETFHRETQPGWTELSLNALEDQLRSQTRIALNQ